MYIHNLFQVGNLDVTDSLPNITTEESVESVAEISEAQVESQLIEQQIEQQVTGIEDATAVGNHLEGLIEEHTENIQKSEEMTESEVQNAQIDLAEGMESVAGFLGAKSIDDVFSRLNIGYGYNSGLNSVGSMSSFADYKQGLEGVAMLASTIWIKIKQLLQRFIQWIQKWITKAIVWIKDYSKKAEKLSKEAENIKDDSELKTDKLSPLAKILMKTSKLTLDGVLNGQVKAIERFKKQQEEMFKNLPDAEKQLNMEVMKESEISYGQIMSATAGYIGLVEYVDSPNLGKTDDSLIVGLNSTKKITICTKKDDGKMENTTLEYDTKELKAPELNGEKGKDVKSKILEVCKDAKDSTKKVQDMLSKSENMFREAIKKVEIGMKGGSDEAKMVRYMSNGIMSMSKLVQKIMISTAYAPGYFLTACSELLKGCEKGEDKEEKKEEK